MITRNLSIIAVAFLTYLGVACNQPAKNQLKPKAVKKAEVHSKTEAFDNVKLAKQHIDSLTKDTSGLIVLVKVPGKDKLVLVKGKNYPEQIETTYNLYKNKAGKIIYTVEVPFSESGDWFIVYKSYFDITGKLFAFTREANFFNSECTPEEGDVAHELLTKYYNKDFKVVDSVYKLKDSKGKDLKKPNCAFNYNYPYKIAKTADEWLKANHLGH